MLDEREQRRHERERRERCDADCCKCDQEPRAQLGEMLRERHLDVVAERVQRRRRPWRLWRHGVRRHRGIGRRGRLRDYCGGAGVLGGGGLGASGGFGASLVLDAFGPRDAASNSLFASPMERASFGIRSTPKSSTATPTIARTIGASMMAKIGVISI